MSSVVEHYPPREGGKESHRLLGRTLRLSGSKRYPGPRGESGPVEKCSVSGTYPEEQKRAVREMGKRFSKEYSFIIQENCVRGDSYWRFPTGRQGVLLYHYQRDCVQSRTIN